MLPYEEQLAEFTLRIFLNEKSSVGVDEANQIARAILHASGLKPPSKGSEVVIEGTRIYSQTVCDHEAHVPGTPTCPECGRDVT